jgi:hypothetical protein
VPNSDDRPYTSYSDQTPDGRGALQEKVASDLLFAGTELAALERLLESRDSRVDRSKW